MNGSTAYETTSPITLYQEWMGVTRLGILTGLSIIGCFMAGCVITSIFVQKRLCRLGNSFLGAVALSDIVDCALYMPISMLVIMSQQGDNYCTCLIQLFFGRTSITFKYLVFMFVSIDDFKRLRKTPQNRGFGHTPCAVVTKILASLTVAIVYSTLSTFGSWGPAYCDRQLLGVPLFQYCSFGLLFVFPTLVNVAFQIITIMAAHKHFQLPKTRRPPIMNREWNLALINIGNFGMLFITTAPSIIVQTFNVNLTNGIFYVLFWLTIVFRSSIMNAAYGISNVEFQKGFAYTIRYCFMRNTVHTGRQTQDRNRRIVGVRFHVMQPVRIITEQSNSDARIL